MIFIKYVLITIYILTTLGFIMKESVDKESIATFVVLMTTIIYLFLS